MKNFLIVISLLFFSFGPAQLPNRFDESAQNDDKEHTETAAREPEVAYDNPGNVGDPTPIDGYIPLLALTAIGLIIYITQKKKNLLS